MCRGTMRHVYPQYTHPPRSRLRAEAVADIASPRSPVYWGTLTTFLALVAYSTESLNFFALSHFVR